MLMSPWSFSLVVVLPLNERKAEKESKHGACGRWFEVEFGAPCLFFDVIVLLSEQWMWLGMSADGQIRSYYMYPKGKEGTLPPIG